MGGMYKEVGRWEGYGMSGGGGWTVEGGLKPPLGLFKLGMSPISAIVRPNQAYRAYEMFHYNWGEFQTHTFHIVPPQALLSQL